jgi:hypothetical protein
MYSPVADFSPVRSNPSFLRQAMKGDKKRQVPPKALQSRQVFAEVLI